MSYYCNICKKSITGPEYDFSMDNFNKALCRDHQPTPEARKLGHALEDRGWDIEFEKLDGFKHIDIAITEAKVNIEVDGIHHHFNNEQALADLKRAFHSFKKGFLTIRIPNSLVRNQNILEKTADYISRFLNESIEQLEYDAEEFDDDFWI